MRAFDRDLPSGTNDGSKGSVNVAPENVPVVLRIISRPGPNANKCCRVSAVALAPATSTGIALIVICPGNVNAPGAISACADPPDSVIIPPWLGRIAPGSAAPWNRVAPTVMEVVEPRAQNTSPEVY